jgi:hypothetical protein
MNNDPARIKALGWVPLIAGVFIILLMGWISLYLGTGIANHTLRMDVKSSTFIGGIFVGFAVVTAIGCVGIANGMYQLRTGRRSKALTIAGFALTAVAFGTFLLTISANRP